MQLHWVDLIVFVLITFGNVLFGASFFFKNRTTDQFTAGGGNMPAWWLACLYLLRL